MKHKLRVGLVLLPIMMLGLVLTGCGKQSSFIDAKKDFASNMQSNQQVTVKVTNAQKSEKFDAVTATVNAQNTNKVKIHANVKYDVKSYSGNLCENLKTMSIYLPAETYYTYLGQLSGMALPSNSAFNNKYVEVTAEQMNITKDQIKNNQMIGSTDKYQSSMVDNLKDVLKKSDNSDFKKDGSKITYTYTKTQLKSLIKKANTDLKADKSTKDLAFNKNDLKGIDSLLKGTTVTETVDTQNKSVDYYTIKHDDAKYQVSIKNTKASDHVILPSGDKTISMTDFQTEIQAALMASYD